MAGETITTVATIDSNPAKAGAAQFNAAIASMRDATLKTSQALDGLTGATALLRGGLGLLTGAFAVKSIVDAADQYTVLKVRLESLTGSAAAGAEVLHEIKDAAKDSRTSTTDLADAYGKMAGQLKDHNLTSQQAISALSTLSKAMQLGGSTADQTRGAFEILSNSFTHGRVEMRQFFTLMQDAPLLMQKLQQQTGMSAEQLRRMAQAGKISGETILAVLGNATTEINAKFAAMPRTIRGSIDQVTHALSGSLGKAFSDSGAAGSEFVKAMDQVRDALKSDAFVQSLRNAADLIGGVVQKLMDMGLVKINPNDLFGVEALKQGWSDRFKWIGEQIIALDQYWKGNKDVAAAAAAEVAVYADNIKFAAQAAEKAKASWMAGTTVTPGGAAAGGGSGVPFAESDIEKSMKREMELLQQQIALNQAKAVEDKKAIDDAQTELDVRAKVTDQMREVDATLAKVYESQIRVTSAAKEMSQTLASNVQIAKGFYQTISDDIVNGIKAGDSMHNTMRKILADMAEMIAKATVLNPLLQFLSVGTGQGLTAAGFSAQNGAFGSGGVGGFFGSIGSLFGFANGGDFTVGGSGGTDSQLVAFRASPDETVSIRRPGQSGPSVPSVSAPINISINVAGDATDATIEKFRRVAMTEIARATPQLTKNAVSAVQDTHRRDPNYWRR